MNGGKLHAPAGALRFNPLVQVGTTSPTESETRTVPSIAAATQRLAATLQEMRGELEYTRQLTELAQMTGELRALAAELAATQRAFLEAERAAANQELANLRRSPVEPPVRVEYRPLPARPRAPAAPAAPVTTTTEARVELAGELVDLRGLVERVADPAQHAELTGRLERLRQRLQDPAVDCEAIRTEIAVMRALLYRALRPKPVRANAERAGGTAEAPAAAAVAAADPAPTPNSGRAAPVEPKVQELRNVVVGLAALVVVMLGLLVWSSRRPAVSEPVAMARSEAAVSSAARVAPRTEVPPAAAPAVKPVIHDGRYVDEAGRFRCQLPEGWEMTADSSEALSSLRLRSGRDEIFVLSHPAAGEFDLRDRPAIERQLAKRVNQLTRGELFAEVVEAKWVTAEEVEALQMVLRMAVGAETWRVLAVNYRQHGHEHLLLLYVRSEGREASLQATFQKFVYQYDSIGAAAEPEAELPFLRGVVAEAMTRPGGPIASAGELRVRDGARQSVAIR